MGEQNVPHDEWLKLLERSRFLLSRSRYDAGVWQELTPLNQRIRRLAELPTTKDTWPTRIIRQDHP